MVFKIEFDCSPIWGDLGRFRVAFVISAAKVQKNSKSSKFSADKMQNLRISDQFCTFAA